jgi:UDP-glucose-4-epimerase GalE
MTNPRKYYQNNVIGTFSLLQAMQRHNTDKIVFSSTAAIYGHPKKVPIDESEPSQPINVYGKTKWMAEEMIRDCNMKSVMLRYFNAAGADASVEIGEAHTPETHLIPLAIQAALGKSSFKLFGNDHATPDGTPIRDFIHVSDLAKAHVQALQWLLNGGTQATLNLGSGQGHSVAEVISMIEKKIGKPVPREIIDRNPSDPPALIASIAKAQETLKWIPKQSDLETIISSAIEWHMR